MPKIKLAPKQITTKGIWIMLGGLGMFAFSSFIFLTQGRQIETGFLSGVLNGLFLSGILLVPIGFIAFVYGLVSEKKTSPIFILSIVVVFILIGFITVKIVKTQLPNPITENKTWDTASLMQRTIQRVLEDAKLNIRDLHISVSADRVVTINGIVPSVINRERVEKTVAELPGVMKVINNLRVE